MKDSLTKEVEELVSEGKSWWNINDLGYGINCLKMIIRLLLDIRDKLDNPERLPYVDIVDEDLEE